MSPSLRSVLRTVLAGAIAATVASPAPAADKVAVGTGGSASDAPFYIAYDKGFLQGRGPRCRPDRARFRRQGHRTARHGRARRRQRRAVGRLLECADPRREISHRCRSRAHRAGVSLPNRVHAQGPDRQRPVQEPQGPQGNADGLCGPRRDRAVAAQRSGQVRGDQVRGRHPGLSLAFRSRSPRCRTRRSTAPC